ncbi:MAG: Coenzyme F420 hydrogenase/dehydrogenase, beta subunit C-terminal domain [Lachnospiraceae bacterium]|nr:Coenzyme F420 hydrogenase/dehydrogenase, beta subunit C-terminal domain [Lachnospiraceae bacterium]
MITISSKEQCCACTACQNICPQHCISMQTDSEGFKYPKVEITNCIGCNLCEKVCPIKNNKINESFERYGIIARNVNLDVCEDSTSGGVASAIIHILMEQGYEVCGAAFDDDFAVHHQIIKDEKDTKRFRGSKFVQSDLRNVLGLILKKLKMGEKIVFIGTPCQVAGAKNYFQKEYDNLFCIDFVCRGVPSPKIWSMYIDEMQKKYNSKFRSVKFRSKTYGYHSSAMRIEFVNGKKYIASGRIDPMMKAFVNELVSRPSCHSCNFKSTMHRSDLTLFDCKNYSKITGLNDDDKGYTSVIVQSQKGNKYMELASKFLINQKADLGKMIQYDGIMVEHSAKENKSRKKLFELIQKDTFIAALNKVDKIKWSDYCIERSKSFLYKTGLIRIAQKVKKDSLFKRIK